MKWFFAFLVWMTSLPAWSVVSPYQELSTKFIKIAEFKSSKKHREVYYGHEKIGFFKAKRRLFKKGKMFVEYIPPTYRYPTEFYVKKKGMYQKVLSAKNVSPLPPAFNLIKTKATGKLSDPFFLIGGSLPRSRFKNYRDKTLRADFPLQNKKRFSFPMIVNRLGEIVWVYIPVTDGIPPKNYPVVEPLGNGKFGLLLGRKTSTFEVFNWKGERERLAKTQEFNPPQPVHHDFIAYRKKSFVTLGYAAHKYDDGKEYISSTVMRVYLNKRKTKVLKDFGLEFHPKKVDWEEERGEGEKHFYHWDMPQADHDFTHANGLRTSPAGHLISFRHLSKILLMEKDTLKTKWTVGSAKDNTFVASGKSAFKFQHSPILDENGNLLLFDNNPVTRQSRILALKLKNKEATMLWEFPKNSEFYSKDRGSVVLNSKKNVIAFFVSPKINGKNFPKHTRSDYIIEYSPKMAKELGRIKVTFFTKSPGYRATPLKSIGVDKIVPNLILR